jgi:hypothetical protein
LNPQSSQFLNVVYVLNSYISEYVCVCVQQLKSLERSFDELMKQNMEGGVKKKHAPTLHAEDEEYEDMFNPDMSGAPRSRLGASRSKDA